MDLTSLLAKTKEEEASIYLPHFDAEDAWKLGNILVQLSKENGWPLTIGIECNERLLFHYACQQNHLNNQTAVTRKKNVAHAFRCSSLRVFCELELSNTVIGDRGRDFADYLPLGGAFPIQVTGVGQIGTVCVSGLAHFDDHKAVVAGLKALLEVMAKEDQK